VRTDARQRDLCSPPKKKEAKQTDDSFSHFAQGELKYKTLTNQWHSSTPPNQTMLGNHETSKNLISVSLQKNIDTYQTETAHTYLYRRLTSFGLNYEKI
jgi:hypothetical protein